MGNDRIRKAKIEMFCLTNSRNIFSVNDVYEDTLWTVILLIFKTTCYFGNLSHDFSYLLHLVTNLLRTVGLKESKCDKQALEGPDQAVHWHSLIHVHWRSSLSAYKIIIYRRLY